MLIVVLFAFFGTPAAGISTLLHSLRSGITRPAFISTFAAGIRTFPAQFFALFHAGFSIAMFSTACAFVCACFTCGNAAFILLIRHNNRFKLSSDPLLPGLQFRCHPLICFYYNFRFLNLSELTITETELKLIANAAIIGDSKIPKKGYKTPAAIGMPSTL